MGGDEAPRAVVDGALVAARRLGAGLIPVGDRSAVTAELHAFARALCD